MGTLLGHVVPLARHGWGWGARRGLNHNTARLPVVVVHVAGVAATVAHAAGTTTTHDADEGGEAGYADETARDGPCNRPCAVTTGVVVIRLAATVVTGLVALERIRTTRSRGADGHAQTTHQDYRDGARHSYRQISAKAGKVQMIIYLP